MKEQIRRKLHSARAFSLAETLLALLILLLASTIMVTGIPSAVNAYRRVVRAANAEVLLSTTITTLRNELGTATNVAETDGKSVTYFSSFRNAPSRIFMEDGEEDGEKDIRFQRYFYDFTMDVAVPGPEPLISPTASTEDLYVTYSGIDYANGVITIDDLSVKYDHNGTAETITSRDVSIRVLSG